MTVEYDATFVVQQIWAYLTTIIGLSEEAAAGCIGAFTYENNRSCVYDDSPDPTNVESILDEMFYIGPQKEAAMADWNAWGLHVQTGNPFYRARDGLYYPGIAFWSCTGNIALDLIEKADSMGMSWYDLDPQCELFKEAYFDANVPMAQALMGGGSVAECCSYGYGLMFSGGNESHTEYGAIEIAERVYSKHAGSNYTYTGMSAGSHLLDDFINQACSYDGYDEASWAAVHSDWYWPGEWCAGFVSGVASDVGDILGVLFDGSLSAHACAWSVGNYGGEIHLNDPSYTPKRGDLALVNDDGVGRAAHITIIQEVSGDSLLTIEGNYSYEVHSVPSDLSRFNCYCSPNWPASSGGSKSGVNGFNFSSLFENKNTRKDAIMREVGYLDDTYEPTTEETDIKLCVINYTELFEAFWDAGLRMKKAKVNVEYDYSKLDSKVRAVVEYFTQKGYDPAVGCGIAACLQNKTGIDTMFKDESDEVNYKLGILPWPKTRSEKMQKHVGEDWNNNVTGQLDYINFEMDSDYVDTVKIILSRLSFSESSARTAASIFGHVMQDVVSISDETFNNKELAAKYFGLVVRKITYSSGNVKGSSGSSSSGEYTYSGNEANASEEQKYIAEVAQSGEVGGAGGYCLGWVNAVYQHCGYECYELSGWGAVTTWERRESASLYGSDMSNIPLAACVVTTGSNSGGAGHIGIYIGNGNIISQGNTSQYVSAVENFSGSDNIDGFVGTYGWVCPNCGFEWK